jgi:uncharacterized protein (TIGR02597 family)
MAFHATLGAQTVARTTPVGYVKFTCLAGSDTAVSVPFHATPRWRGRLSAEPTSASGGLMRLSFAGNPGFATDSLINPPHYLYFPPNSAAAGRTLVIAAHAADSADVRATEAEVSGLVAGTPVQIIPAWTLNSLFPPSTQTTMHVSASPLLPDRRSEILFFDETTRGKTLAPTRRFFLTPAGWFESGTFLPAGGVTILPGQPFTIRHPAGSQPTNFVPHQQVFGGPVTIQIRTQTAGDQDTMVAPPRPVAVKLPDLGLNGGLFEVSPSTAPQDRRDQLMVFDNSTAAFNKQPSATYFRTPSGWVRDAPGFPAAGNVSINPSAGMLIRKATAANGNGATWVNQPNYDVTAP